MIKARTIYGLGLRANVPVAGLMGLPAAPAADVSLTIGSLPGDVVSAATEHFYTSDELDESGRPLVRVETLLAGEYYRISYSDGTRIVIDAPGARMWAEGPEGADVEETSTYLLGPVLGFLLRLRGTTALHASAVVVDGKAVAFAGPAGAGKSSTAAAFARRGYSILADDVVPISQSPAGLVATPAYPRLRLWPDSAQALFDQPLPRITPSWDKCYLDLSAPSFRFQREPLLLAAVYVFGSRDAAHATTRISALSPRDALVALVAHTCAARLLTPQMRSQEFDLLAHLGQTVPVRRLTPPEDLAGIDAVCAAVLEDFRALDRRVA